MHADSRVVPIKKEKEGKTGLTRSSKRAHRFCSKVAGHEIVWNVFQWSGYVHAYRNLIAKTAQGTRVPRNFQVGFTDSGTCDSESMRFTVSVLRRVRSRTSASLLVRRRKARRAACVTSRREFVGSASWASCRLSATKLRNPYITRSNLLKKYRPKDNCF